jgi:hydrogenase maturation protein HypF
MVESVLNSESRQPQPRRIHLLVRGVVQGVGFRPYVYQLASRFSLGGFVLNTGEGVVIEVEGPSSAVEQFLEALPRDVPPLVRITEMIQDELAPAGAQRFEIRSSRVGEFVFSPVPPDIAVCDACLAETRDPADRRYEYAFTNCTHCGPRYSIILDVPYDRALTTMGGFTMCAECRAEYEDPTNRRFHAQPNACPVCGPHLWLTDSRGQRSPLQTTRRILESAVDTLNEGGIVAWKGIGGYQIACDARNADAIRELRRRKQRSEKAFAVMVGDSSVAEGLCEVSPQELAVLNGAEKPITLLQQKQSANLAEGVAPGSASLGIMLPYTPLHDLLFRILDERCGPGAVLVMTSGNLSEEPIVIDEEEALQKLCDIADVFVHHNRPIHTRVDDSVVCVVEGRPMLLRRARGYAPVPLPAMHSDSEVLAVGAQQKSTFCLTRTGSALLSQHLGDLENLETLEFFEQTLDRMQRLFHVKPQTVVHDLHPNYLSTLFAQKVQTPKRIGVQHHHAHIAACMAEHRLNGKVIGVAWDGTGYGTDGAIWGGEFLIADLTGFKRFAHLRYIALAGGDAAVREPWRVARSYLRDALEPTALAALHDPPSVPEASVRMLDALLEKRVQSIDTSSCGRLFDAVASLIGLHQTVSFEGQAAMALEAIAGDSTFAYNHSIDDLDPLQVDMRPMIRQIVQDVAAGVPIHEISARFHNTLIAVALDVCLRARQSSGLSRVCLSGGCFQNVRLLTGCLRTLRHNGFEVFFPQSVPANDGGISLGQAAIACERLRQGV